jgi:hypothetical protein
MAFTSNLFFYFLMTFMSLHSVVCLVNLLNLCVQRYCSCMVFKIMKFPYSCLSLKFSVFINLHLTHHEYHVDFRCILKFLLVTVLSWDVAIQRCFLTSTWKQQVGKFWPGFLLSQMDICILVMPRYAVCYIVICISE